MPVNLGWREAIVEVLKRAGGPMHYTDIAEQISELSLREDLGPTPSNSVAATITVSFQKEGQLSPFMRVGRGIYSLASTRQVVQNESTVENVSATTGVVNAFGMFWSRDKVSWISQPRILGQQQIGSSAVDFGEQKGVYLLHDDQGVVYVGRVTDQGLGKRLFQHTLDRLNGRWSRFSWFGVFPVRQDGSLAKESFSVDIETVIVTMEAVLIEGLEPRQNRKRGDDFQAVEFLQAEDPQLVVERKASILRDLLESVKTGRP
jgi:hypothetical protein